MMPYVLYIARHKQDPNKLCPGSSLCIHLAEFLPDEYVEIKNCDELRRTHGKDLPSWLVGSPTLVSTSGSDIFRGTYAVQHMEDLAISYAQYKGSQQATSEKSRPPASGKGRNSTHTQPQPILHVRPEEPHSAVAPDSALHDEDEILPSLWESRVPDTDDDLADGNRKITGDDLARAISARQQDVKPLPPGPPPPPPLAERDS